MAIAILCQLFIHTRAVILVGMTAIYKNGQLTKVRFTDVEQEQSKRRLYLPGTRLLFVRDLSTNGIIAVSVG